MPQGLGSVILKRGETAVFDAPSGATELRIYGAGKGVVLPVADGKAELTAAMSEDLPAGDYASEWHVVVDGRTLLPDGPALCVRASARADGLKSKEESWNVRVLAAARAALLTAAASGEVSMSVGGQSFGFQTRAELVEFVAMMERRVARERGRKRMRTIKVRL